MGTDLVLHSERANPHPFAVLGEVSEGEEEAMGAAEGGGAEAAPAAPAEDPTSPPGGLWEERVDEASGVKYYYNKKRGSQWAKPDESGEDGARVRTISSQWVVKTDHDSGYAVARNRAARLVLATGRGGGGSMFERADWPIRANSTTTSKYSVGTITITTMLPKRPCGTSLPKWQPTNATARASIRRTVTHQRSGRRSWTEARVANIMLIRRPGPRSGRSRRKAPERDGRAPGFVCVLFRPRTERRRVQLERTALPQCTTRGLYVATRHKMQTITLTW